MPRFHPQVRRDATQAIRYYDSISDSLGDDFWARFEDVCIRVELHPTRFHFDPSGHSPRADFTQKVGNQP